MRAFADHLDRRVTIQRTVKTRDAVGQAIDAWEDVATVWAEVKPESGSEGFETDRRTNIQRVLFRVRYREGIDTTMRVVYRGQVHQIVGVSEPDRLVTLELSTEVREKVSGVVA
jgi:SPP1 family predicted phage head-tail adaptor